MNGKPPGLSGRVAGLLPDAGDLFPSLLLALCYCSWFYYVNLLPYLSGGISEREEMTGFLSGWLLVPALSLIASLGLGVLKRKRFGDDRRVYPVLLFCNALVTAVLITLLHLDLIQVWVIVLGVPVVNAVVMLVLKPVPGGGDDSSAAYLTALLPVIAVFALANLISPAELWADIFQGGVVKIILHTAIMSLLGWLIWRDLVSPRVVQSGSRRFADIAVAVLITLATYSVAYPFRDSPLTFLMGHHHNFYLGPVNDLIGGRSLLADINCQYGVGVIYFVAGIFQTGILPLNYQGFALLLSLLLIAEYVVLYFMLRLLCRPSLLLPVLGIAAIVGMNYFLQQNSVLWYPSVGPLRFGLTYLLLFAVLLRAVYPGRRRLLDGAVYTVLAVSSVWSFEAALYSWAVFVVMVLHQALTDSSPARRAFGQIGRPLLLGAAGAVGAHILVAVDVLRRTGELPHWNYYLDYIRLYSTGEFGTLPIGAWGAWIVPLGIYVASALALAYRGLSSRDRGAPPETSFVAGMTAFGIVQFTYFIGRSHPNNVLHIFMPALLLLFYWAGQILRQGSPAPPLFRRVITGVACVAIPIMIVRPSDAVTGKIPESFLWALMSSPGQLPAQMAMPWTHPGSNARVDDAVALLRKYSRGRAQMAVLLDSNETTEALMIAQKSNVFPMSNPTQDGLLPSARARILNSRHRPGPGDVIIYDGDPAVLNPLENDILNNLRGQFDLVTQEIAPTGVVAAQLVRRPDAMPGNGP